MTNFCTCERPDFSTVEYVPVGVRRNVMDYQVCQCCRLPCLGTQTTHVEDEEPDNNANEFRSRYTDTADLMTALDDAGIESDQDWKNERTTWAFDDGSKIVVSGSEVTVLPAVITE